MRTIETMTADVVMAFVRHHKSDDLPSLVTEVHAVMAEIDKSGRPAEPFVPVDESKRFDHLTCLQCGKETTLLERHLRKAHDITPQQYRVTYSLPADYPMVTQEFSLRRSEIAKSHGLGRSNSAE